MIVSGHLRHIYKCIKLINTLTCHTTIRKLGQNFTVTEKTLTGRIISYLNYNKENNAIQNPMEMMNALKHNPTLISKKMNLQELRSCIRLFCGNNTDRLLNAIDRECCNRIYDINIQETCDILHSFVQTVPNHIIKTQFYRLAIDKLNDNIESLNTNELIQLIFFTGLQKKSRNAQSILRKCMKHLNPKMKDLDANQLCIVCNSFFKTSTKVNTKLLSCVYNFINNNLAVLKDPALFITFVKIMRQNKFQSEELLTNVSCAIFFNQSAKMYNCTALCHILALYADFYYYDDNLFNYFVKMALDKLNESTYKARIGPGDIRSKDINRLLWSLANVNYQNLGKDQIKNVIIKKVMERIDAGEYDFNPDILVEIVLYLWMLNYRAYEIIPNVLTEQIVGRIQDSKSPVKQRLNLLLSCVYYEDPKLYKKLNLDPSRTNTYSKQLQIEKRPVLQRVFDCLKLIAKEHDVNRYEMGCQIPHLNVIGITGYRRKIYKALHVEVLDEHTTVKNTDSLPHGMMELKLRLMDKMEDGLVIVDSKEICDMTEYELQQHLLDSINLVS